MSRKIKLVNKCPMTINIYDEAGEELLLTLEPEGEPARVEVRLVSLKKLNGLIPLNLVTYGEPGELPPFEAGTFYIVSTLYRSRSLRHDLYSPGRLVRSEDGVPVGCRGLVQSQEKKC